MAARMAPMLSATINSTSVKPRDEPEYVADSATIELDGRSRCARLNPARTIRNGTPSLFVIGAMLFRTLSRAPRSALTARQVCGGPHGVSEPLGLVGNSLRVRTCAAFASGHSASPGRTSWIEQL